MNPLDGPLDVVLFGSYDVERHPRVAVLREGIAANGHRLSEINRPLGMSTADKVRAASSLRGTLRLARQLARSWWALRREGRAVPAPDLVVVGYLGHFDVHLARRLWPDSTIVLDHLVGLADTARDRGVATGAKYRLLRRLDRAALDTADVVLVDTDEQLEQLAEEHRARAVVVPVGATTRWFDEQRTAPPPPPLRVCYVGLFTPLHGTPVIGRAIAALGDDDRFEFTLVGSGQDLEETRAAVGDARARWIDWVRADDLPGLVGSQHVCLGIFGTTDKAMRVVPTKVYQGHAAGNIVITSDTPPQRRALGDAAIYVPPGDAEALAARLRELADDPEGVIARRRGDERFRPERVVRPLLDRLASTPATRDLSQGPALPPNAWLRFDLVRRDLELDRRAAVLEIGPGRGAVAARMVAAGHDYTGIEPAEASRAEAGAVLAQVPGGTWRLLGSLDELEADERFDLVFAFEVLEHIPDDVEALSGWTSRLRPGGRLVLSVPGFARRFSAHDHEVGHLRRYDPDDLRRVAEAAGLVDVQVRAYGFPLGYLLESGRNAVSAASQRRRPLREESAEQRTARSGRWFQPPRGANRWIQGATWPFRMLQRPVTGRGTGLVLTARAPLGR